MMRKTVILLFCYFGVVLSSPVGSKNMPIMREEQTEHKKTEVVRTPLNLPSNATSIRADIVDGFTCVNKTYGYYADIGNDCQIFHVCLPVVYADGKENTFRWSFICPEETLFSQESFTCVRGEDMNIDCGESEKFYYLNRNIGMGPSSTMQLNDMEDDLNEYLMKSDFESADNTNSDPSSMSKVPIVEKLQNTDENVFENKNSIKKKWQKDRINVLENTTASAKEQQKDNLEQTTVSNRRKITVKGSQIKASPPVYKKSKPAHVVITRRKYNNNYKTAQIDKDNVLPIKPLADVPSADEIITTTKKSTEEDPNKHLIKTNSFVTFNSDMSEKQEQNMNIPIIADNDTKNTTAEQQITNIESEPEKIAVNEMVLKDQDNEKDEVFEDKTNETTESLPLAPSSTTNSIEQNLENSKINDPVPTIQSSDTIIEELQKEQLSPQQAEDFIIKEITSLVNAANLEESKATTNDEVELQSDMISSLPVSIPIMNVQDKNVPNETADVAIDHKEGFLNKNEASSIIPFELNQSSSPSKLTESVQEPEIQGTLEGSSSISIPADEIPLSNSHQHHNPTNKMGMQTNQHYPLPQEDMVLMSHSNVAPNKSGHKKIIPMSILNENGDTIAQFGRPHVFHHMKPIVERIIPVQNRNRADEVVPIFHRRNNYHLNLDINPPQPIAYRNEEEIPGHGNSQATTQGSVEDKEQTLSNEPEVLLNKAQDNSMKATSSEIMESSAFSTNLPSKPSMQNEESKPTNLSISVLEKSEPLKDGRTALDSRRRRFLFRADAH